MLHSMHCYKPTRAKSGQNPPRSDHRGGYVPVLTKNDTSRASTSFPPESEGERGERARNQTSTAVRDSKAARHGEPRR